MECLQPAVLGVESALELAIAQRKRTVYRLDGGSGTDENLRWLLQRHYQTVAKGFSGKRATALARQVQRWDRYDETSFLGTVPDTLHLGRPVDIMVRKRLHQGKWKHSYYVSTLVFPSKQAFFDRYSQRGAAEIEQFRTDKSGLHLSARRMRSFEAQKAMILLTDLAHNLLADFQRLALVDSPFSQWGLKRIVRDLLAIPGRLYFVDGQLKRIELLATHQHADAMIICLEKYCSGRLSQ